MTRLQRARELAERWSGEWLHTVIRSPCKPTDGPCAWFYPEDIASLALEGYPAHYVASIPHVTHWYPGNKFMSPPRPRRTRP